MKKEEELLLFSHFQKMHRQIVLIAWFLAGEDWALAPIVRKGYSMECIFKKKKTGKEMVSAARIGTGIFTLIIIFLGGFFSPLQAREKNIPEDRYTLHPEYDKYMPEVVAVLPMDNLSLEPEVENYLYNEIYERLKARGYVRISVDTVMQQMSELGVQTPGQIAGFSPETLGRKLNCDAVLIGQVEQSAAQHTGVYDAVVVSVSVGLIDCKTGERLWSCEQWRTAHRQWQLDPINALINLAVHEKASRKERVAWLVQEMLKTLPQGPVQVVRENLLDQAVEIKSQPNNSEQQN